MENLAPDTVDMERFARVLARHRMALPALLMVVGHRPLAFIGGQLLYVLAPLAAILGISACGHWAELLSEPGGTARLEQLLEQMTDECEPGAQG